MRRLLARASALSLGLFGLLNAALELMHPSVDANIWWIDVRWMTRELGWLFVSAGSGALLALALMPHHRTITRIGRTAASLFAIVTTVNAVVTWNLIARGHIQSSFPVPLSMLLAGLLALIAATPPMDSLGRTPRTWHSLALGASLATLFPLAQMATFGNTDYRRPSDTIVVFGARVYASGRPSDALQDRLETAVELFRAGFAKSIFISGGPGEGEVDEASAMTAYLTDAGIPRESVIEDHSGTNTAATLQNLTAYLSARGATRALAVSHFYHLPRIKLEGDRLNVSIYTVPANQRDRLLAKLSWFIARESAAWWKYYARAVL